MSVRPNEFTFLAQLGSIANLEEVLWDKHEAIKAYVRDTPDPNLVYVFCELDNISKLRERINAVKSSNQRLAKYLSKS